MAHTRSEVTVRTPALQVRLAERDRRLSDRARVFLAAARADLNRRRRTPFPPSALEAE